MLKSIKIIKIFKSVFLASPKLNWKCIYTFINGKMRKQFLLLFTVHATIEGKGEGE